MPDMQKAQLGLDTKEQRLPYGHAEGANGATAPL